MIKVLENKNESRKLKISLFWQSLVFVDIFQRWWIKTLTHMKIFWLHVKNNHFFKTKYGVNKKTCVNLKKKKHNKKSRFSIGFIKYQLWNLDLHIVAKISEVLMKLFDIFL